MLWPAFHFHSVLLIFVNLWPISTLCVADMMHAVADMVCGRYRRFPNTSRVSIRVAKNFGQETDEVDAVKLLLTCSLSCKIWLLSLMSRNCRRPFICLCWAKLWNSLLMTLHIGLIAVSIQKETENTLISAIISGRYFLVCYGFFVAIMVLEVNCYLGHVKKCNVCKCNVM